MRASFWWISQNPRDMRKIIQRTFFVERQVKATKKGLSIKIFPISLQFRGIQQKLGGKLTHLVSSHFSRCKNILNSGIWIYFNQEYQDSYSGIKVTNFQKNDWLRWKNAIFTKRMKYLVIFHLNSAVFYTFFICLNHKYYPCISNR